VPPALVLPAVPFEVADQHARGNSEQPWRDLSNRDQGLGLALADGNKWLFVGEDASASAMISELGTILQLESLMDQSCKISLGTIKNIDNCLSSTFVRMMKTIRRDVLARDGLFLHGALAEKNGFGVILAGPSGVGKTTASIRLPRPWRSLSDDMTLVVRDAQGRYWGHPWPTWSFFWENDNSGRKWDVSCAVPLKSIFFLAQAGEDRVEPIGEGQATCMLLHTAQQASGRLDDKSCNEDITAINVQLFNNACIMAKSIKSFILNVSLNGPFWREMDLALNFPI
jgi:SynChlorMet cassette protein ScmC